MKKIITGLLTLLIFSISYGQDSLVTKIGGPGVTVEALGGFKADSGFQLPMVPSTKRFTKGMKSTGQLLINTADSALYILKNNLIYKVYSVLDTNLSGSPVTPSYVATAVSTAGGAFIPLTQKAAANGVASLDSTGKVPIAQLSSLVIGATFVSVSKAAMLALSASVGDVCVRTDSNLTFRLQTAGPTVYTHWVQLLFPQGVTSFNGRTLSVIGRKGDYTTDSIAEGVIDSYYTAARTQAVVATDTGSAGWIANGRDVAVIKTATGSKLIGRVSATTGRAQAISVGAGLRIDTVTNTLNNIGGTLTGVSSATAALTATPSTTTVVLTVNSAPLLNPGATINGTAFTGGADILLNQAINSISTDYQLILTDNQKLIYVSGSSGSLITIPSNAVVAFPIGTHIDVVSGSLGSVSFNSFGGVTIDSQGGHVTIAAKFVGVTLIKIATNEWLLIGNLI